MVVGFDEHTVTVKSHDMGALTSALDAMDPDAVHPRLPDGLGEP